MLPPTQIYVDGERCSNSLCIRNTFRVLYLQIEFAAPSKQPPVIREQLQDTEICALYRCTRAQNSLAIGGYHQRVAGVDCLLKIYNYSTVLICRYYAYQGFLCDCWRGFMDCIV